MSGKANALVDLKNISPSATVKTNMLGMAIYTTKVFDRWAGKQGLSVANGNGELKEINCDA
jgi:hypothetical protein